MVADSDIVQVGDASAYRNLTEAQYLEVILGPKNLSLTLVLPLTILYVVTFVTGVFGNVATCLVIVKNTGMQTATNYYLFNLAVSDLTLLLLGLPNDLSVYWQQYPWLLGLGVCKIRAYVSELSSYVSVLTIVAFSMERYLAICHPLHLYAMSGLKRPIRFILAAWSIALVCGIPFAVYTTVNYVEYPAGSRHRSKDSAFCAMLRPNIPEFPLYELSCVVFFLVPMVVIVVLYTRMGFKIRTSARNSLGRTLEGSVHGETKQVQSRKAIVRMLSAVVIMFFICWAPFHAQRLLYIYAYDKTYFAVVNEWLFTLGGCLYYLSTTVNPILYNVMSAKYRRAFKETLCCLGNGRNRGSRDPSSFRETIVCRCDSRDSSNLQVHARSSRCSGSLRCTIGRTREILRSPGLWAKGDAHGNGILLKNHYRAEGNRAGDSLLNGKASQTGKVRTKCYNKLEERTSTENSNM